jgi:DNA-binding LacI/PurR family transcriptional regulator
VVGDRPKSPAISWVDTDNETGGYASAARLLAAGHRQIAFLGVTARNANIEDRLAGVRRALAEKDLQLPDGEVYRVDIRDPSPEGLAALLAAEGHRTAVVCSTDLLAIALLAAARARGIRVPEDLSIIGFDGIQNIRYTDPPLDSNRQPLKEMAFAAAEILFQRIENPDAPPGCKVFGLEEIRGGSVAPPAHRAE